MGARAAVSARFAVQGIAHRIQYRRLAGAGRSVYQKQLMIFQPAEINNLTPGIGTEGVHFQI